MRYEVQPEGLRVWIDADDDPSDEYEALESLIENGWDYVQPSEIGALTDSTILSDEAERNDYGDLQSVGRIFWDADYMVENPLDAMRTKEGHLYAKVERNAYYGS